MDSKNFNTLFTGKFLLHLKETESTNDFLKQWLAKNKPIDGAVILAERQTAGKGQSGNQWQSEPGQNLTFSVLYQCPFLEAKQQFLLNVIAANAVRIALQNLLPEASIRVKWPNDILLNEKKVCGILIENSLQGQFLQRSIIGIGINVLQEHFDGLPHATSMRLNGYEGALDRVLAKVLEALEGQLLLLKGGKAQGLVHQYEQHLYGMNEDQEFFTPERHFKALVCGIDAEGQLVLEHNGKQEHFQHKAVSWKRFA